ncbi:hypothetical protein FHR32_007630 [Streptosporangium album]|uniref:Lipoprotein LpqN n=1 Tax=Streptosporangium album TaxID=47479 RepID=A0A7W7WEA1_9ACTN|nr:hypothetical protein [Streptosporangium album]MBB4943230.1 hypothetical protein [Streptosporangium album]
MAGALTAPPAPAPTESNPPGDIPDNTAFVPYRNTAGSYEVKVPEGWARTDTATGAAFTDKLNSVKVEVVAAASAPTEASARAREVPELTAQGKNFELKKVDTVKRDGGSAVRAVYRTDSEPDPVTGKVVRDQVERYEFFGHGHEGVLTLSGPVNADNVDPWMTVSNSFRWL